MKLIFMGTPDFAAVALKALVEAGQEVAAVVTQPDRPKGRGKEVQCSPVKTYAVSQNIPVLQPKKIRETEAIEELKKYEADAFVVAAFGQILSEEILKMPRLGCLNIHASLLPKYRGAAPIPWAILDGEKETGVTIMQMDVGLDTGDILFVKKIPIENSDTAESLHDKLADIGAELIVESLNRIEKGDYHPVKQQEKDATYVGKLDKTFGLIQWDENAEAIERKVRGLHSWPSAYTFLNEKRLKIWEAKAVEGSKNDETAIGKIVKVEKECFYVATGNGELQVTGIQLEGKRKMNVKEFILGYHLEEGTILGKNEVK